MKKKLLIVPVLVFALFAAACGASETNPPPDDRESALSLPPATTAPAPDTSGGANGEVQLVVRAVSYNQILVRVFDVIGTTSVDAPDRETAETAEEETFLLAVQEQIAAFTDATARQDDESDIEYFERRAPQLSGFSDAVSAIFTTHTANIYALTIAPRVTATAIDLAQRAVARELEELSVLFNDIVEGSELPTFPLPADPEEIGERVVAGLLAVIEGGGAE